MHNFACLKGKTLSGFYYTPSEIKEMWKSEQTLNHVTAVEIHNTIFLVQFLPLIILMKIIWKE